MKVDPRGFQPTRYDRLGRGDWIQYIPDTLRKPKPRSSTLTDVVVYVDEGRVVLTTAMGDVIQGRAEDTILSHR